MAELSLLPLTKEDAARVIAQLARDSCKVTIIDNCSQGPWQGTVTTRQIYRCLEAGEVITKPSFNPETGYWECRMQRFAAGQDIEITVALNRDRTELIVINICEN